MRRRNLHWVGHIVRKSNGKPLVQNDWQTWHTTLEEEAYRQVVETAETHLGELTTLSC